MKKIQVATKVTKPEPAREKIIPKPTTPVPTETPKLITSLQTPKSFHVLSITHVERTVSQKYERPIALIEAENGKILCEMKKDSLLIGRCSSVDLDLRVIISPFIKTISRTHARIIYDHDSKGFLLQNTGRNGTRVDGVLYEGLGPATLNSGSTITMGRIHLRFKIKSKP